MAVTLTELDLKQPDGELDNSFFPKADLDAQLTGWLAKAAAKVEANANIAGANQNAAAEAWVYYQAYTYIANQIGAMPQTTNVNAETVVNWGNRQDYWRMMAEAALESYTGLVAVTATTVSAISSYTTNVPTW